jgi:hypothetical protein
VAADQPDLLALDAARPGASHRHILTVPGRKTGRLYSTPVDIVELDGEPWLIAGYGAQSFLLAQFGLRLGGRLSETCANVQNSLQASRCSRSRASSPSRS